MNNYTKEQLEELLKIAYEQEQNHCNQVSGVWSISGMEFCEQHPFLNYDDALDYEEEEDREDFYDFYYDRKRQFKELMGDEYDQIPEKTLTTIEDAIYEKAQMDFDWDNEGAYFWHDICEQIRRQMAELGGEDE